MNKFVFIFYLGIHEVKLAMNVKNFNLNRAQPYDPITPVARDIGRDTTLLCFDEFQVKICTCFFVPLFSVIPTLLHIHTHHLFNDPLSRTTRVGRYQKGKTNLDFTEARDSEW